MFLCTSCVLTVVVAGIRRPKDWQKEVGVRSLVLYKEIKTRSRRILNRKVEKRNTDGILGKQEYDGRKNRDASTWNRPISSAFYENKALVFSHLDWPKFTYLLPRQRGDQRCR